MSVFSLSGLGSGIDFNNIVDQLIQVERQPIKLIENKISTIDRQNSVWQEITSKISEFENTVQSLSDSDAIGATAAESSDQDFLSAISTSDASSGNYSVEIIQLAQNHKVTTSAFSDSNAELNLSGEILVGGKSIDIENTDTLNNIAAKINNANEDVNANVLKITDGEYKLVISSAIEGASNSLDLREASGNGESDILTSLGLTTGTEIISNTSDEFNDSQTTIASLLNSSSAPSSSSITINGSLNLNIDLNTDTLEDIIGKLDSLTGISAQLKTVERDDETFSYIETTGITSITDDNNVMESIGLLAQTYQNQIQEGKDSILKVDSIQVTRSSNSVSDVIDGVTLNLKQETTSKVNLSITRDSEKIEETVQGMVDAYNDLVGYINSNSSYDQESNVGGALLGDSTASRIKSDLSGVLLSNISNISKEFSNAFEIGFSITENGTLSLDKDKLNEAVEKDPNGFYDLFNKEDVGIRAKFLETLDYYTDTIEGPIKIKQDAFESRKTLYNDRIDRLNARISRKEQRMRLQFSKLEQYMSSMQNQGNQLAGISTGLFG